MAPDLHGREIAFLVANEGVEQVELTEPWRAIAEAGGQPVLIAPKGDDVQAFNHLDKADRFLPDTTVAEAEVDRFTGLVLPGGVANPDELRTDDAAVAFARAFFSAGKPVAAICHAPWTLIEAGVVDGRHLTSWPSLRTDIRNAGGDWVDDALVEDDDGTNLLITSRKPADLPEFCPAVVAAFAAA
jgi:deglycase